MRSRAQWVRTIPGRNSEGRTRQHTARNAKGTHLVDASRVAWEFVLQLAGLKVPHVDAVVPRPCAHAPASAVPRAADQHLLEAVRGTLEHPRAATASAKRSDVPRPHRVVHSVRQQVQTIWAHAQPCDGIGVARQCHVHGTLANIPRLHRNVQYVINTATRCCTTRQACSHKYTRKCTHLDVVVQGAGIHHASVGGRCHGRNLVLVGKGVRAAARPAVPHLHVSSGKVPAQAAAAQAARTFTVPSSLPLMTMSGPRETEEMEFTKLPCPASFLMRLPV